MEGVQALERAERSMEELVQALDGSPLLPYAQKAAQALEEFGAGYHDYRQVCNYLYDGVHISDGEGTVLFINEAYTRITGIHPRDIVGRKVQDIEAEGKLYKGSATLPVLKNRRRETTMTALLNQEKELLITGTPVFDKEGEIRLVVCNTRDFPELKKLEQELLTLREKGKKAEEELAYLRRQQVPACRISSRSPAMQAVVELIQTVADTDVTLLITGESGTGKEVVANEIYQSSNRRGKPFIKVNCAAIPAQLLESELFGYEGGAFTGAKGGGKAGLFELANSGVILLDEIGDMPLPLQSKLLRVLQERALMRIGGSRPIKLDIRVIASTNRDLREAVRTGAFREDLFYRLNVVPVVLRPLRERREDIPDLVENFCHNFNREYGKDAFLSPEGLELLMGYDWPGNIRELENLIERLVVTSDGGPISQDSVQSALQLGTTPVALPAEQDQGLKARVAAFEQGIVRHTLEQQGSLRKAARVLKVDHSTLAKKCKRYGWTEKSR